MTATPEHDKIDELRTVNPLATNLLHLLLSVPGWVIVNDLVEPPVKVPVSRIAAALLGVDAVAYRAESEARFGLDDVPAGIADLVLDWSKEDAVIDELRGLAVLAAQRATDVFEIAVAESPVAAAAGRSFDELVSESTVYAVPDPEVPDNLRGTIAGAAVAVGLLDAGEAAAHPAAALPFTGIPDPAENPPAPAFIVPAPQTSIDEIPTHLFAPGSAPLVADEFNPFTAPAPLLGAGAPAIPSPFDAIMNPAPGAPAPFPGDVYPVPPFTVGDTFPSPFTVTASPLQPRPEFVDPFAFDAPPADNALAGYARHHNVVALSGVQTAEPDEQDTFSEDSAATPLDPAYPDDEYGDFDDDVWVDSADEDERLAAERSVDPFDVPYGAAPAIIEGTGDLADANDDDDEQLIYPGYEPKNAPLA